MRLIDADKAKEKLRGNAQKDGNPFVGAIVEMFCEFLDQAPTVEDAEERGEIGSVPQWIPVTERMPEGYKVVLVRSSAGFTHTARYVAICDEWQSAWNHDRMESEITHWMPLPEPPEVE